MNIVDMGMMRKMRRALREANDLYDMQDVKNGLNTGAMQGHVVGDTWAITQVFNFPKRRSVNILFVIGNLEDTVKLENKIEEWAKSVGANLITAVGREGWWKYRTPGWKKIGVLYAKDI